MNLATRKRDREEDAQYEMPENLKIRILHVDDEPDFLALTQGYLERGHTDVQLEIATSAQDALTRLTEQHYDVVISDYLMPKMDGLEFLKTLRERGNVIPFIMFTGKGREEVAIEALNRGANHYIQKGTDIESMYGTLVHAIREVVTKQRAEMALRLSEHFNKTIISSVGEGVIVYDRDLRYRVWNEFMERITGLPAEKVLGKAALDLFPHLREQGVDQLLRRALAGETVRSPDTPYRVPQTGATGWVVGTYSPHTTERGEIIGVVGTVREITDRKLAEKALQESKEEYQTIFETTRMATVIIEGDMTIARVNAEFERQLGYAKEEVEGKKKWTEFVAPDDLERMKAYHRLRRIDPEAAPKSYEFRFIHKRGDVRDAFLSAAMIPGTNKSVVALSDISERKQMEDELRRSEIQYRTLFEATGVSTVILNEDGTFYQVNAEGAKISGFSKEELEGKKKWTEFIARKEDLEMMREIHRLRRTEPDKAPVNYEFLFRDRYGNLRNIYVTATIIPGTKRSVVSFMDITERKQAEEELRESEREHQTILDSVPVGLFHIDTDGRFVHVNEVLAARYGMTPDEFKGKTSRELFAEVGGEYIKSDHEVLESGKPRTGVTRRIETPEGDKWVRLDKVPVKDAAGNVTGIIGFELDVTERQQAVNALQEREKEHQTILDSVPVGLFHIDTDGRFVHVNEALATRYGIKPEDFKGKTSRELFPDVGEEYIKSDHEVLEFGEPRTGVTRKIETPEGEKWVRLDKVPVKDAAGNVTGLIGFELDITARVQAQEALRNAHRELQEIIEFLPDATLVIDRDRKVIAWNRAIEEMTGIKKTDIIGKGNYEYTMPFYGARRPMLIDLVFSSEKEIESHYAYVEKKGTTLFAEAFAPALYGGKGAHLWGTAKPLIDSVGTIVGAIESIRDITDHKQAEEERERLLKELEAKNMEMEHFTYTISHDLRSPLVTIQGIATMLERDLEQNNRAQAERGLQYISKAATQMDHLLRDTLHLSRIGRVANPPEDVPFGAIIQDAVEQTAEQIKASGVELSVAGDFPAVHVDKLRIVEVLVNLIGNSIKYRGDQPRPKIEIDYRVKDGESVFFVKDNGIGIDKSEQEKVFELFYRGDTSTEGTGAGLAIVKRIIEVHGGRIWIESEKGKGTTVYFTLPVR